MSTFEGVTNQTRTFPMECAYIRCYDDVIDDVRSPALTDAASMDAMCVVGGGGHAVLHLQPASKGSVVLDVGDCLIFNVPI